MAAGTVKALIFGIFLYSQFIFRIIHAVSLGSDYDLRTRAAHLVDGGLNG